MANGDANYAHIFLLPALLITLGTLMSLASASYYGIASLLSGWNNAHATFYGGSDASGTMGMPRFLPLSFLIN